MHSENLFETVSSRYGSVTFFANDTGAISESLRRYGEWAENELSFMLRLIREGDTVLDVGAYIGTHSMAFARRVGPGGQVVSIEAQARSFELLRRNLADNGLIQVRPENAIASSSASEKRIRAIDIAAPGSYGSESLRDVIANGGMPFGAEDPAGSTELAVRSIVLDDLRLPACALIKIDVEGMEDMVLGGLTETIRAHQPVVFAECNSLEDGLRTIAAMRRLDYRVRAHVALAYNADNFRGDSRNIFDGAREIGLVATPRSRPDPLDDYAVRACELLLDIETADDLALALLNKPQYEGEVLRLGAAARTGGNASLDAVNALRRAVGELRIDVAFYQEKERETHEAQERAVHALHEQLNDLRAELHRAKSLICEREQLGRAREAELQARIDEVLGSTSWRLTAPLRALGKAARRG